jgi:hypothetical protein
MAGISRSSLEFEYIVNNSSPVPERKLNGGLYTGEPFAKDAEYANVPVLPYSAYWISENIKSANPPKEAVFQMQAGYRPGNNTDPDLPGLNFFKGDYQTFGPINTYCFPSACEPKNVTRKLESKCSTLNSK